MRRPGQSNNRPSLFVVIGHMAPDTKRPPILAAFLLSRIAALGLTFHIKVVTHGLCWLLQVVALNVVHAGLPEC